MHDSSISYSIRTHSSSSSKRRYPSNPPGLGDEQPSDRTIKRCDALLVGVLLLYVVVVVLLCVVVVML